MPTTTASAPVAAAAAKPFQKHTVKFIPDGFQAVCLQKHAFSFKEVAAAVAAVATVAVKDTRMPFFVPVKTSRRLNPFKTQRQRKTKTKTLRSYPSRVNEQKSLRRVSPRRCRPTTYIAARTPKSATTQPRNGRRCNREFCVITFALSTPKRLVSVRVRGPSKQAVKPRAPIDSSFDGGDGDRDAYRPLLTILVLE